MSLKLVPNAPGDVITENPRCDYTDKILLDGNCNDVVEAMCGKLYSFEDLYANNRRLVTVDGSGHMTVLCDASFLDMFCSKFDPYRTTLKGFCNPRDPDKRNVSVLLIRGTWPDVRVLKLTRNVPCISSDGSVHSAGFVDAVLVVGEHTVNVPLQPTQVEAAQAARVLCDVVKDFPFESDSDLSAWIGYILTNVARLFIKRNVLMFAVTASARGSGKTKLIDLANIIALGSKASVTPAPRPDSDEGRKAIFAALLGGAQSILMDNVTGTLQHSVLDAALTSGFVSDRILGKSKVLKVANHAVFACTGNGLQMSSDLSRRSMYCTRSCSDDPSSRTNFEHADLESHVTTNQVALRDAALTIVRAWVVAGKPETRETIGSFGDWSRVVLGALAYADQPSPITAREISWAKADGDKDALRAFLRWLAENYPNGATVAKMAAPHPAQPSSNESPKAAIKIEEGRAVLQALGETRYTSKSIRYALRHLTGQWADDLQLQGRRDRSNTTVWFAHTKPQADSRDAGGAGDAGSLSPADETHDFQAMQELQEMQESYQLQSRPT